MSSVQVLCFSLVLSFKKFSPQSQVKNWDELWLNVVYLEAQLIDSLITKPSSNTILNSYHSDKIMVHSSPTSLYKNSKVNIIKSNRVRPCQGVSWVSKDQNLMYNTNVQVSCLTFQLYWCNWGKTTFLTYFLAVLGYF